MKNANLISAIVFTVIYIMMLVAGIADGDSELAVGSVLLSIPVVINWLSWVELKK